MLKSNATVECTQVGGLISLARFTMPLASEVISWCLQKCRESAGKKWTPKQKTNIGVNVNQISGGKLVFLTMAMMWRAQLSHATAVWDLWAAQTLNCHHVSPDFLLPWTSCLWAYGSSCHLGLNYIGVATSSLNMISMISNFSYKG